MKKIFIITSGCVLFILLTVLSFIGGVVTNHKLTMIDKAQEHNAHIRQRNHSNEKISGVQSLVKKALPSVVNIYISNKRVASGGSGSVLTKDGVILTNFHVAADKYDKELGNADLMVEFSNHQSVPAQVVGLDPATDLAILKADVSRLTNYTVQPFTLGYSHTLKPGQEVISLGNPLFLDFSVGAGVISNVHYSTCEQPFYKGAPLSCYELLVSDVPTNHGNSGGALIDTNGYLVGVPSLGISAKDHLSTGLNLSIPIDNALRVATELIRHGSVEHRKLLGLIPHVHSNNDLNSLPLNGVDVRVEPDSPAYQAHVPSRIHLVEIEKQPMRSINDVLAIQYRFFEGDTVTIKYTTHASSTVHTTQIHL